MAKLGRVRPQFPSRSRGHRAEGLVKGRPQNFIPSASRGRPFVLKTGANDATRSTMLQKRAHSIIGRRSPIVRGRVGSCKGEPRPKRDQLPAALWKHAGDTIRRMGSAGLGRRACISVRPVGIILTPAPSALKRRKPRWKYASRQTSDSVLRSCH